jgi:hypothetical protein
MIAAGIQELKNSRTQVLENSRMARCAKFNARLSVLLEFFTPCPPIQSLSSTDLKHREYDLVIIGTGMGGGTLAYALRESGLRVLLVERGDYLPQEPENWMPSAVFFENRYKPGELFSCWRLARSSC